MGYLSQKKQQARENIFLYFMAALLTGLTVFSLSDSLLGGVGFNLFHLFCLSALILSYCLIIKKYKIAVFFGILFLVNYTSLSAVTNIFISDNFKGSETIDLYFGPEKNLLDTLPKDNIVAAGSIILAQHYKVPYAVLEHQPQNQLTLIRVDLRKAKKKEFPLIFEHLQEFILKQDNPVIIFGEFGLPAWAAAFKNFMAASGLSVKNRLVFSKGAKFNIFSTPGFYVLGFQKMGLSEIIQTLENGQKVIKTTASFMPEHS